MIIHASLQPVTVTHQAPGGGLADDEDVTRSITFLGTLKKCVPQRDGWVDVGTWCYSSMHNQ